MNVATASRPANKISTGRIALLITLGAETVFFATLLVAYAALREQVEWNVPHTLTRLAIPLVNSIVMLISALTAWWSGRAIHLGNQSGLRMGLLVTLLLGLIFVAGQAYEFSHAGFQINDEAFGGVFFTLLGFHALHVLAGVVFLALNLVRANLGDFSATKHEPVVLGNVFWYYVTGIWIVLFAVLYLI